MQRLVILLSLGAAACGGDPQLDKQRERGSSAKTAAADEAPAEPEREVEEDSGAMLESTQPKPGPAESTEPKKPAEKPSKPKIGWLDEATGYRFVFLKDPKTFAVADVENDDFAAFLDLTPQQRKDAAAAKEQGTDNAIALVTTFYPAYGVLAGIIEQLVSGLGDLNSYLRDPNRRKSLCERELGAGWHFVSEELVSNAEEDEIVRHVDGLKDKSVWLTAGFVWKARVHEFTADGSKGTTRQVLESESHGSLCALKSL